MNTAFDHEFYIVISVYVPDFYARIGVSKRAKHFIDKS